jgi:spoIIIJ-associated protein
MKQTPKEILETVLGNLGFEFGIEEEASEDGLTLQISSPDAELLTGPNGQRIDDLQYLLNRVLQAQDPCSPKVQVDVEHFRDARNRRLLQEVRTLAESVRKSGLPFHLEPMSSYDRRLVHNAFRDDPQITTWSPPEPARVKRITLKLRETSPLEG